MTSSKYISNTKNVLALLELAIHACWQETFCATESWHLSSKAWQCQLRNLPIALGIYQPAPHTASAHRGWPLMASGMPPPGAIGTLLSERCMRAGCLHCAQTCQSPSDPAKGEGITGTSVGTRLHDRSNTSHITGSRTQHANAANGNKQGNFYVQLHHDDDGKVSQHKTVDP